MGPGLGVMVGGWGGMAWRCLFLFLWPYLSMWVQGGWTCCVSVSGCGFGVCNQVCSCQCALAGFVFRDKHTSRDSPRVARSCGSCTLACKRNCDTNSVQLRRWPQAAVQHTPHWSTPTANLGCSVAKPRQRCLLATHQPLHRSSTTAFLREWRDWSILSVPPPTRHRASHCVFPPTESFFLSPTVFSTRHATQRTTQDTSLESSLVVTFRGLSRHTLAPDAFSPALLTWSFQILMIQRFLVVTVWPRICRCFFMGVSDFPCVFSRWCVVVNVQAHK